MGIILHEGSIIACAAFLPLTLKAESTIVARELGAQRFGVRRLGAAFPKATRRTGLRQVLQLRKAVALD